MVPDLYLHWPNKRYFNFTLRIIRLDLQPETLQFSQKLLFWKPVWYRGTHSEFLSLQKALRLSFCLRYCFITTDSRQISDTDFANTPIRHLCFYLGKSAIASVHKCFTISKVKKGSTRFQFYTQLIYKPHFETWVLLFGPFGQLRTAEANDEKQIEYFHATFEGGFLQFDFFLPQSWPNIGNFCNFGMIWLSKSSLFSLHCLCSELSITILSV